jgi:tetratricopeptide (TPR) repeat protein
MKHLPASSLLLSLAMLVHAAAHGQAITTPDDAVHESAAATTNEEPAYLALQRQWEQARYATAENQRIAALEKVATQARAAAKAHPGDAAILTWEGIILASLAGEKGGLGALSLCREARRELDRALAIEPRVLDGSAYTTLGSLYYQVPGWPIGFGDEKKARALLTQALEIDPRGIDANYFYGDFLREQGEYDAAIIALERALAAPARPARALADQGRRIEIERVLAQVRRDRDG